MRMCIGPNAYICRQYRLPNEKQFNPDIVLHITSHNKDTDQAFCNGPTSFGTEEKKLRDNLWNQLEHSLAFVYLYVGLGLPLDEINTKTLFKKKKKKID